jgi:high affinity Mn2+ porin
MQFVNGGAQCKGMHRALYLIAIAVVLAASMHAQSPAPATDAPTAVDAGPETPVTMFPHSDTMPWMVSGQMNTIAQGHGRFHSPYEGTNSLRDIFEVKESEVSTLFTGWQPHHHARYNTDFLVDFENAGGRGISEALGLAGQTNLDVVRNPNLSSAPYFSRGEIHQTIGFTDEMTDAERTTFSLATKVPVRRIEMRAGKMSMPDTFDLNDVGTDSHLQFTNWTIDNNGAWDYAADTRGYTVGGVIEYDDRAWSFRYGIAGMPTVANGIDLDWAWSRSNGQNWELELRKSLVPGHKGTTRLLSYMNHAHMGDYRQSVQQYLNHQVAVPEITNTEKFGAVKYGFGINQEQDLGANFRAFARFGWNEDQHESYAYTEVGQSASGGVDYAMTKFGRANDKIGVAFVSNAIKRDHQAYLHYGGSGFLLGDGGLTYGRENIVESYYTTHFWRGIFGAIGFSEVWNPGYNRDRGPVAIPMARIHIDY